MLDTVVALNGSVGEAWMRGEFEVFEEHLYSEQMRAPLLRQAINSLPASANGQPRILLTTVPEERHELGLLMVEGLLALEGRDVRLTGHANATFRYSSGDPSAPRQHCRAVVLVSFSRAADCASTEPVARASPRFRRTLGRWCRRGEDSRPSST